VTLYPVASLVLSQPADDELRLVESLLRDLAVYNPANDLKGKYYEGEQRVRMLNIAVPPELQNLETVVGWPGTTVDVVEERLDWYGWTSEDDDYGLSSVYTTNQLGVEAGFVHLDSLIYGIAFAIVGAGAEGEPDVLVTPQSPLDFTGRFDPRSRRLSSALKVVEADQGTPLELTLYMPDETVTYTRPRIGGQWQVLDRDQHNLGRVPVVRFPNRPRGSRLTGRSEISKAVRYYTDHAVRAMLGMEINREFYSAPQRYALGVEQSDFVNTDGTVKTGWETIMGRVWAIGRDENGDIPEVGQFPAQSPAPYLDQVRGLAQLLAAEAGIPPTYLGFQTDNPASADAIQRAEARLVKRVERRQATFGQSWLEVARLSLLVRDGSVPDGFEQLVVKWREASTPTRSAAADEATKLVGAGILPPDSSVTLDRIGLSPAEQRQLAADRRRVEGRGILQALTAEIPVDGNAG
jgi:hypothetical protein